MLLFYNIPTGLNKKTNFSLKWFEMADNLLPKKEFNHQPQRSNEEEIIEAYKRADNRERDILWMKYRYFRRLFDDIEKNNSPSGLLFR